MMTTEIRMLEFFSGIGGMRLATIAALDRLNEHDDTQRKASLTFCQSYDISLNANRCYLHNFHAPNDEELGNVQVGGTVSTKLVEQLKPQDIDKVEANFWTMSPPCQPFTSNGAKDTKKYLDSDDKRCNGLKGLIRLLSSVQQKPLWILLENVKGFATSDMAKEWFACLRENGYSWKSFLLSPIQFGIPNHRRRFYILAERSSRWSNELQHNPYTTLLAERMCQNRTIGNYLSTIKDKEFNHLLVPDSVLEKNFAKNLGIVTAADTASHCFTAGYGRIYHRSTGSLLLMDTYHVGHEDTPNTLPAVADQPLDRSNMMVYSGHLRRFSPSELLSLFGFPKAFQFPSDIASDHQYKLIGNSISICVVTELVLELLGQAASEDVMLIGGSKGHEAECITGQLLKLYNYYRWKMIPNCTGRSTCRDHEIVAKLTPIDLLRKAGLEPPETTWQEYAFELHGRQDRVLVVPIDSEMTIGLITFEKNNGESYVHTFNTPSGFRRKLESIGIHVTSERIWA